MAFIPNREQEDYPASTAMSRFLVIGFLNAALLGLLAGLIWLGWNWIR
jgi:hypothetical protein